jgi:type II secretory pathway component GspD/PulD (secretin)
VISAHIVAANLRFRDYTQQLYSQTVGFNIGRDWAVLGLSGAAAVASQGAANALAAASAGLVGAGTAVSKNAYYEKTLPALIAAMEANRKRVVVRHNSWQISAR